MSTKKPEIPKPVKRRDFLKLGLQAAGALTLASIGGYFALKKPNYEKSEQNPYDLGLDSIGIIPKDKYCNVVATDLEIPCRESKALAVDNEDNIYVSGDKKIYILNKDGKVITRFDTEITATALAISDEKIVYAALENHIVTFNNEGKLLKQWQAIEAKSYLTSIALGEQQLFVADAQLELVHVYTCDGSFVQSIGSGNKQDIDSFVLPSYFFDVAIAPDKSLWAANTGKHKLLHFDSTKHMIHSWGNASAAVEDFCGCCNPSHFAIMSDGSFITAEKGIVRVKKYDANGNFVGAIAGPEHFQQSSTGLEIAINSHNEILVLEPAVSKIHIFNLK